jgi:hypothetical protein
MRATLARTSIAEVRLCRGATDKAGERICGEPTDDENGHCNHQVREPQEELAQHVRDRRKSQRVKAHDEGDQANEPLGDKGDETGRISFDASVALKIAN